MSEIYLQVDDFKSKEDNPERLLFIAVILQALLDATKPELDSDSEEIIINRARARAWFNAVIGVTAQDFRDVCDLAGLDPAYTKTFAKKIIYDTENSGFKRKMFNRLLDHAKVSVGGK